MPLTVLTPPPNPAKSFFFRRVHLPSTCSRVMPIGEIIFAPSFKPCLNEKEVQNAKDVEIQTKKTSGHRRATTAAHGCDCSRVRRFSRTEHEALARVIDRAAAARRRSGRHHRVQCDQNAPDIVAFCVVANHSWNRFGRYQVATPGSQS